MTGSFILTPSATRDIDGTVQVMGTYSGEAGAPRVASELVVAWHRRNF